MKLKIVLFTLGLILSINILYGQQKTILQSLKLPDKATYRKYLKEFAFCHCLINFFPKDSLLVNDGSQDAYFQMGIHSFESINKVINFTNNYTLKNKDKPEFGVNLYVKKCIDFKNSKTLDSLVYTLDKDINMQKLKK